MPRTIQHGISYAYKQRLKPDGTLDTTNPAVAVTGMVSATPAVSQSTTSFYADNVTHYTSFGASTTTVAAVQYQWNHVDKELEFHGKRYVPTAVPTQTEYTFVDDATKYPAFAMWYIVEVAGGGEELVLWTNVTSGTVAGVGTGTTDSTSVTATQFTYTLSATTNTSVWAGNITDYHSSDPTVIAAAKTGILPTDLTVTPAP